jgi:glutamine synthetase
MLAYSGAQPFGVDPHSVGVEPEGARIEVRFPDSSANPYFAFAAMMMAGLDGIQNKIHPGEPADKDLYDLEPERKSTFRRCAIRWTWHSSTSTRTASS